MKETKFKNTEIGRIPEDWEVTPIGKACNVRRGVRVTKEQLTDEGRYPVYQNTNYPMGYFDNYNADANTPFVIVGGSAGQIGLSKERYWAADDCAYFEKSNTLNKVFLYYELTHRQFEIKKFVRTASVPRLDRKVIEDFVLPLPSLHEQHRIASALTSIDNLISSLGKLIEKKKNIKQGTMQQLLTGKIRLKEFNESWVKRKLGDNATIQRGGSPRPIEAYLTTNRDGINWIKIGDVRPNDKFIRHTVEKIIPEGISHSRQVYKGDFILSNSMSFGRPYILDIDGCIHDGWLVIKDYSNTYDMDFLYYILSSDTVFEQYIAMAAGSSVKNLNKEKVANVMLFAPQSLAEQRAIATILNKMDNEITALETKKAKYEAIKQGMMQQLLTGKIRLIS